jgi:hypothetical protein
MPDNLQDRISGHDMRDVRFFYDFGTDILYVGINTYEIAGDVDGDGDPGAPSQELQNNGGKDFPDFGGTECFAVFIDADMDGTYDVAAGLPGLSDISGFVVAGYVEDPAIPLLAFGDPLPQHQGPVFASPNAAQPDLEFTILDFSQIAAATDTGPSFAVNVFMGSVQDDGIGEDYVPGQDQHVVVVIAEIGDLVWEDLNRDGIQDEGEPGVPGVIVNLHDASDTMIATLTTDADGKYVFQVPPGAYRIEFVIPDGYFCSPQATGALDVDSDADPLTGAASWTELTPGESDMTWDMGIWKPEEGPPVEPPGTGTPGYWKNHPEAWPVDTIVIGGVSYTRDQAIAGMEAAVKKDKTYSMFQALVAAKLNVLVGNADECITQTIPAADAWMADNTLGSGVSAGGKDTPWRQGEPLASELDAYNNGLLCAPRRD